MYYKIRQVGIPLTSFEKYIIRQVPEVFLNKIHKRIYKKYVSKFLYVNEKYVFIKEIRKRNLRF